MGVFDTFQPKIKNFYIIYISHKLRSNYYSILNLINPKIAINSCF